MSSASKEEEHVDGPVGLVDLGVEIRWSSARYCAVSMAGEVVVALVFRRAWCLMRDRWVNPRPSAPRLYVTPQPHLASACEELNALCTDG